MYDHQSLRSACTNAQSDQSLCQSLEYSIIVKLLIEHHLKFLSLKRSAEARTSLHMSKCHIVGNLVHWLNFCFTVTSVTCNGDGTETVIVSKAKDKWVKISECDNEHYVSNNGDSYTLEFSCEIDMVSKLR